MSPHTASPDLREPAYHAGSVAPPPIDPETPPAPQYAAAARVQEAASRPFAPEVPRDWGAWSLTDLVTTVAHGAPRVPVVPDAPVIARDDRLARELASMTPCEVAHCYALDADGARRVAAAMELHARLQTVPTVARPQIRTPEQAMAIMQPYATRDHECMWCLALDTRKQPIGDPLVVSRGDVDATEALPRLFYRGPVRAGATSVMAVHNHPAGSPEPSSADISLTRRLAQSGQTLGIALLDHCIITPQGKWQSLRRIHPQLFVAG